MQPVLMADEGGGRSAVLAPPREEAFCARAGATFRSAVRPGRPPAAVRLARGALSSPSLERLLRGARDLPPPIDSLPTAESPNPFVRFFYFFFFRGNRERI